MKTLRILLCLLIALLWHTGGIADAPQEPTGTPALIKFLEGRSYYSFRKGTTCRANDPDRTVLISWRNKLSVQEGKLLLWGTVCNDSPEILVAKEASKDLLVTMDLSRISYKGEVFTYQRRNPKLCKQGTWCPVE